MKWKEIGYLQRFPTGSDILKSCCKINEISLALGVKSLQSLLQSLSSISLIVFMVAFDTWYYIFSGYSTAVGEKNNVSFYIAGAPRSNYTGQVVIFMNNGTKWEPVRRIDGEQVLFLLVKILPERTSFAFTQTPLTNWLWSSVTSCMYKMVTRQHTCCVFMFADGRKTTENNHREEL